MQYLFLWMVYDTQIDVHFSAKCRVSIKKLSILRYLYLPLNFKSFPEFEITSPCSRSKPTDHSPNQRSPAHNFVISLSEVGFKVLVPHSFLKSNFFFLLGKQIPQYQYTKGTNPSTGYAFLSLNNYLAVIAPPFHA